MTTTLQELESLTMCLPEFPESIMEHPGFKEHQMDCGYSFSWALMDRPEISVANWFNSAGTSFPQHTHTQREWLIVYIGSMYLTVDGGEEIRYGPGHSVLIPPNTVHEARFLEDTFYVAICMPRNKDWPTLRH